MVLFWAGDEHFWCWRQMRFTLETNTLVLETNTLVLETKAWEMHVQTSVTRIASYCTNDFQTKVMSR